MRTNRFAMAVFQRSGNDNFARALENRGMLDWFALGTRRGVSGVSPEHTRLQPIFGLLNYLFARTLSTYRAESLRFRLFPRFDKWAQGWLRPGQNFLSGLAYANGCLRRVKQWGGLALADSGISHPVEFWNLLTEEQQRWSSPCPPVSAFFHELLLESVATADYVLAASSFIQASYLKQGWTADRVLYCPYPVDLRAFRPAPEKRPPSRPLTILHVGGLSLRKGAPYLLEALRLIRKEAPTAVLRVRRDIRDDAFPILERYSDLPIEWSGLLNLEEHVRRYQTADVLLFPSIEDGFAFVVAEALACGLPVITTPNTGASELIQPGVNGEVVPIRDAQALAAAALKWGERRLAGENLGGQEELRQQLSFARFEQTFLGHLQRLGVGPIPCESASR